MTPIDPFALEEVLADMLDDVEIPLKNVEYTIQQYLLANGARLDTETRMLLAGVRDCVGRVAGSSRRIADRSEHQESEPEIALAMHAM